MSFALQSVWGKERDRIAKTVHRIRCVYVCVQTRNTIHAINRPHKKLLHNTFDENQITLKTYSLLRLQRWQRWRRRQWRRRRVKDLGAKWNCEPEKVARIYKAIRYAVEVPAMLRHIKFICEHPPHVSINIRVRAWSPVLRHQKKKTFASAKDCTWGVLKKICARCCRCSTRIDTNGETVLPNRKGNRAREIVREWANLCGSSLFPALV